jgi:hypothetical protein
VLDLRTYKLVPGGSRTFDRILRDGALPMLRRYEIDVVGYGPSLADDDHYYLARAFPSARDREQRLGAFYGSDEWKREFDDSVTGLIETYHTVVIPIAPSIAGQLLAAKGQTQAWTQTQLPFRRS